MITRLIIVMLITIGLTACTKKKKSIIPLFGLIAGMEESSGSAVKNTNSNSSSGTPEVSTSAAGITVNDSKITNTDGDSFTIVPVAVTATTNGSASSSSTDSGAITSATVNNSSTSSTSTVFQIRPPNNTPTNGATSSSLEQVTPMANIVSSGNLGDNFSFGTTREVQVNASVVDSKNVPLPGMIVRITDGKDQLLQQMTNTDGKVIGSITVPIALSQVEVFVLSGDTATKAVPVPVTITIQQNNVTVVKIVSLIDTITLGIEKSQIPVVQLTDADGDSVPDKYDAYPSDPTRSSITRSPASGVNTLSFEDKYPDAGDADLNDYTLHIFNEIDYNAQGKVVEIRGFYQHLALGGTFKHALYLRLPDSLDFSYESSLYNSNGSLVSSVSTYTPDVSAKKIGLPVFGSANSNTSLPGYNPSKNDTWNTKNGVFTPGQIAKIKVRFSQPVSEDVIGRAPFDVFAKVLAQTNNDTSKTKYYPTASVRSLNFSGKVESRANKFFTDKIVEKKTVQVSKTDYRIGGVASGAVCNPNGNDGSGSGLQEVTAPDPNCLPYTYQTTADKCYMFGTTTEVSWSYCLDQTWCYSTAYPTYTKSYTYKDSNGIDQTIQFQNSISGNYCSTTARCWDEELYTSGTNQGLNYERNNTAPYNLCTMYADPTIPHYDFIEIHLTGKYKKADGSELYLDANGFPWAIIVPGAWKWPKEGHDIRNPSYTAYPSFKAWMDSRGVQSQNWYTTEDATKTYSYAPTTASNTLLGLGSNLTAFLGKLNVPYSILGAIVFVTAGLFVVVRSRHHKSTQA